MTETQWYEIKLKDSFSSGLKQAEKNTDQFENKISGLGSTMLGVFAGAAILSGVERLSSAIIKLGGDMQQTRIAFEVMLGSADKASVLISELQTFARVTPFDTPEVIEAGKQLLAYGFKAGEVKDQLKLLGNVASGLKIPLGELNYLYGTLKASGRVTSIDVKQFAGRGIPIFAELAKVLKINSNQVLQYATDAKISFKDVQQAFENMATGTGRFAGLMDKQSRSLFGRWSNFKAVFEEIGISIGEKMIPLLSEWLGKAFDLVNQFKNINLEGTIANFTATADAIKSIYNLLSDISDLKPEDMFGKISDTWRAAAHVLSQSALYARMAIQSTKDLLSHPGDLKYVSPELAELQRQFRASNLDYEEKEKDLKTTSSFGFMGVIQDIFKKERVLRDRRAEQQVDSEGTGLPSGKSGHIGLEKVQSATKTITLNITNLVKEINFERGVVENGNEARMVEMIKQVLLTAVNDVNLVSN